MDLQRQTNAKNEYKYLQIDTAGGMDDVDTMANAILWIAMSIVLLGFGIAAILFLGFWLYEAGKSAELEVRLDHCLSP